VNHRQLKVRGRVVHGDAPGLGQQHDEHRRKRQRVGGVEEGPAGPLAGKNDLAEVRRSRRDGNRENGEHHRGLGDGSHSHLAAAAHAAERAGSVESAKARKNRPSAIKPTTASTPRTGSSAQAR